MMESDESNSLKSKESNFLGGCTSSRITNENSSQCSISSVPSTITMKLQELPILCSEESKNDSIPLEEINNEPKLSKRALKRKLKHEKWLTWRPIKRAKEKEKLKQKRQYAREHNLSLGPSRKALKLVKMENSKNKLRVCIDFAFDHLMTHKDICKCVKQFNRCYSLNRRAQEPLQFYVTNFKGKSREEMERYNGYQNWNVNIHSESYSDLFPKEEIVYLTSDSPNVIEELDDTKVYIIGGLVDHNKHKEVTLRIAREQNLAHGKLPISTYLSMKTRQVLTVNHVFEILLSKSSDKLSWKSAFLKTLPERKKVAVKEEKCVESEEEKKVETAVETIENRQASGQEIERGKS